MTKYRIETNELEPYNLKKGDYVVCERINTIDVFLEENALKHYKLTNELIMDSGHLTTPVFNFIMKVLPGWIVEVDPKFTIDDLNDFAKFLENDISADTITALDVWLKKRNEFRASQK